MYYCQRKSDRQKVACLEIPLSLPVCTSLSMGRTDASDKIPGKQIAAEVNSVCVQLVVVYVVGSGWFGLVSGVFFYLFDK